jgi:hypothetical protein
MNQYIITEEQFRPMIIALFRRIGEQLELKEEWVKLPNAERNAMAGAFYNIIMEHSHPYQSERDTISKDLALELCMDARKDLREKVLDEHEKKVLVRLCDLIDAHVKNWNEMCEMQELIKKLRQAGEP